MSDHVSSLDLDELAANLPTRPGVDAHLAGCADCRARLEERRRENEAISKDPRLDQLLERLDAGRAPAPRRTAWPWLVPVALAAAVLLVTPRWLADDPSSTAVRAKGPATLQFVSESGAVVAGPVAPGVRLRLRARGPAPFLVVLAIEAGRPPAVIWPVGTETGAPVPEGGLLEPAFLVTPGDVRLVALFFERPVRLDAVVAGAAASGRDGGASVEAFPKLPDELARAPASLRVRGDD